MSDCNTVANQGPLLTISVVTFNPDLVEFEKTLKSLEGALAHFSPDDFLITIIDNSTDNIVEEFIQNNRITLPIRLIHGQGNVGFGRAHNLCLDILGDFHLILNPDIILNSDALKNAADFMLEHEECGLITPYAEWPNGQRQYLCKRYPAIFDLLLRGFAPAAIRTLFHGRLAKYEMQAETQNAVYWNPPIVSGCFMFFRKAALQKTKGFNDDFFLYFEDFDLSLRSGLILKTAYVPAVRVVHAGGNASKKGAWHIRAFIRSAMTFYRLHGVKIL